MDLEEYKSRDATDLADLVGRGEVTATELLALARARAEHVNPLINTIIGSVDQADARAADRTGLRLGVQVLGPLGSDGGLLQLAGQLERAEPWIQRLPASVDGASARGHAQAGR